MNPRLNRLGVAGAAALLLAVASPIAAQQRAPSDANFRCKDGTYSTADTRQGACSSHGGVKSAVTHRSTQNGRVPTATPAERTPAPPAATAAPANARFRCT